MRVTEIRVKQIRVNQGLGVLTLYTTVHSETAYFIPFGFLILFFFILCTEIKFGLRNLLKTFNTELVKNKTAEQYLFNRDAGDRNYVLEVMVPTLLCKYYSNPF